MADTDKTNRPQSLQLHVFFDKSGEEVGRSYHPMQWFVDCPECRGAGQTALLTTTTKCNRCQGARKIDTAPSPASADIRQLLPPEPTIQPSPGTEAESQFPMCHWCYVYDDRDELSLAVNYHTEQRFLWESGQWFFAGSLPIGQTYPAHETDYDYERHRLVNAVSYHGDKWSG